MTKSNRWLLPEGVEEVLPQQAWRIESYKRQAIDLFSSWGYELVIPPLLEFTDALLLDQSSDVDLKTFKLADQLSGRSLGLRADMTPQTCRIDAHSYKQSEATRLCYAGTVVHSVPSSQLASRTPIEIGAELFGAESLDADIESIALMLESIKLAQIAPEAIHLDLGHVAIYRGLLDQAELSKADQQALFDAFDRKAQSEIQQILKQANVESSLATQIESLVNLHGDASILEEAKAKLVGAPSSVLEAIEELQAVASALASACPKAPMFFDLAELRGFAYHTGLVFAAYVEGLGHSVANGGRFDDLGEAFGRARPATGFNLNVKALLGLDQSKVDSVSELAEQSVLAPSLKEVLASASLQEKVQELRSQGERVVYALNEADKGCSHRLVEENGEWIVKPAS